LGLTLLLAAGCTRASTTVTADPTPSSRASTSEPGARTALPTSPHEAALREIYAQYRTWGRVDDEIRWAPTLCILPRPGRARTSVASNGEHKGKLYSLFARDRQSYVTDQPPAAGQAIVKESFTAERVTDPALSVKNVSRYATTPAPALPGHAGVVEGDHLAAYAVEGDALFRIKDFAGAFVMLKTAARGPNDASTDAGWIYGTFSKRGELTASGRIASCEQCHAQRPTRLFGLAEKPLGVRETP